MCMCVVVMGMCVVCDCLYMCMDVYVIYACVYVYGICVLLCVFMQLQNVLPEFFSCENEDLMRYIHEKSTEIIEQYGWKA